MKNYFNLTFVGEFAGIHIFYIFDVYLFIFRSKPVKSINRLIVKLVCSLDVYKDNTYLVNVIIIYMSI